MRDKQRMAWAGGIGAIITQSLISGPINVSLRDFQENVWGLVLLAALMALVLWINTYLVVRMDETALAKYLAAGAAGPFIILNTLGEGAVRAIWS